MKDTKDDPEGFEPTEEVGPDRCDATVPKTGLDIRMMDEETSYEQPKFSEELQDAYRSETAKVVISPEDGLPIPADESSEMALAPEFTVEKVVCVEDESEYVEVFVEEDVGRSYDARGRNRFQIISAYRVSEGMASVPGSPDVRKLRRTYKPDGTLTDRERFLPEQTIEKWGLRFGVRSDGTLVHVRPRRERCIHYKRQILLQDGASDPDEKYTKTVYRNCMARRSVGGAFMSVSNEAILACDYRDPPDPDSIEKYLDNPDRTHLKGSQKKLPLVGGGIFGGGNV